MSVEKSKGRVISYFLLFKLHFAKKNRNLSMVCRLSLQIFRAKEITTYSNFNVVVTNQAT